MRDQELADKVVALEVGEYSGDWFSIMSADNILEPLDAEGFVRDWRVAGAMMEKAFPLLANDWIRFYARIVDGIKDQSIHELPRAIIEACVEVQTSA